eukprot:jgi/Mesen1/5321/ME000265S04474
MFTLATLNVRETMSLRFMMSLRAHALPISTGSFSKSSGRRSCSSTCRGSQVISSLNLSSQLSRRRRSNREAEAIVSLFRNSTSVCLQTSRRSGPSKGIIATGALGTTLVSTAKSRRSICASSRSSSAVLVLASSSNKESVGHVGSADSSVETFVPFHTLALISGPSLSRGYIAKSSQEVGRYHKGAMHDGQSAMHDINELGCPNQTDRVRQRPYDELVKEVWKQGEAFHPYWGSKGREAWTHGVGDQALEKLKEFNERGTYGGEKLGVWARKKIQRGIGWRVKSAIKEFTEWEKQSTKENVVKVSKELNIVYAKNPTIQYGVLELEDLEATGAPETRRAIKHTLDDSQQEYGARDANDIVTSGLNEGDKVDSEEEDVMTGPAGDGVRWIKRAQPDRPKLKGADLEYDKFTRVYDVVALKVPADSCGQLVWRLGGHLLNWPRVKNVGRVSGDDGEHEGGNARLKAVLEEDLNASNIQMSNIEELVRTAVYGPIGDVSEGRERDGKRKGKASAWEKMSRPKPKVKDVLVCTTSASGGAGRGSKDGGPNKGNSSTALEVVEVLYDSDQAQEDIPGYRTSGMGLDKEATSLSRKKGGAGAAAAGWLKQTKTRLLLLSHDFVGKRVDELPIAVQAVLKYGAHSGGVNNFQTCGPAQLVHCRLTLTFDYWSVEELLQELLPPGIMVPTSFEQVGHIAHLNLREEHLPHRHIIAQVILEKHQPRVLSVVNKTAAIHSQFRTMKLELLAGNPRLITTLHENNLSFKVDFSRVYWNSKLASERLRLISKFSGKDVVCDMFAGVGPIAVAAAKKVKKVHANDLNPCAVTYLAQNVHANNVLSKVEVYNQDGRDFIRGILALDPPVLMTQVVMNLPGDAVEFLDAFLGAFFAHTWGKRPMPMIHVYGFSKAADPEAELTQRILQALGRAPCTIDIHRVRLVAPAKWMLCASFQLPAEGAFNSW